MIATVVVSILLINAFSSALPAMDMPNRMQQPYLVRNDHVYDNNGQFALAYQLNDGTQQMKQGSLVPNAKGDDYVMDQQGSYSFLTPEGIEVKMSYTAGKDGFKVTGYPLPVPAKPMEPQPPQQ